MQVQLVRLAQMARWTGHHLCETTAAQGGQGSQSVTQSIQSIHITVSQLVLHVGMII